MATVKFEQAFDKALSLAEQHHLTVTPVPDREEELLKLFERAMVKGFDNHARLTQIQLPMERFPSLDSKFWHVPIEDCGDVPGVALLLRNAGSAGALDHAAFRRNRLNADDVIDSKTRARFTRKTGVHFFAARSDFKRRGL